MPELKTKKFKKWQFLAEIECYNANIGRGAKSDNRLGKGGFFVGQKGVRRGDDS